jgi:ferredoxin
MTLNDSGYDSSSQYVTIATRRKQDAEALSGGCGLINTVARTACWGAFCCLSVCHVLFFIHDMESGLRADIQDRELWQINVSTADPKAHKRKLPFTDRDVRVASVT